MGGKGDAGHQVRMLYPTKDDAHFDGLRDHMLGPAKDIAELARRYDIPYSISSGVRTGEKSAHGEGFALDWALPDFFAAALLREMNNRWGPKGYFFSWHPNRVGFDADGKAMFDEKNFHFHGQLKQQRYKGIMQQERSRLAVDEFEEDRARRLVQRAIDQGEPTEKRRPHKGLRGSKAPRSSPTAVDASSIGPNASGVVEAPAPPSLGGLTNFRQSPALRGSVKTQHLSSQKVLGPALPPRLPVSSQGLIVGDFEKTRAHQAPAIATDRILQNALREVGRKTLIEGG